MAASTESAGSRQGTQSLSASTVTSMPSRKKTIGISADFIPVLEAAMNTGLFAKELDVAKFAVAIAIRLSKPGSEMVNAQTKWNVGSFDDDGSLRRALQVLFPDCDDPVRKAEQLLHDGLEVLCESQTGTSVPDILRLVAACGEPGPIAESAYRIA